MHSFTPQDRIGFEQNLVFQKAEITSFQTAHKNTKNARLDNINGRRKVDHCFYFLLYQTLARRAGIFIPSNFSQSEMKKNNAIKFRSDPKGKSNTIKLSSRPEGKKSYYQTLPPKALFLHVFFFKIIDLRIHI